MEGTVKTETIMLTAERKVEMRESDVHEINDDEVLVECVANGICMLEVSLFRGTEKFRYPLPLGHEGIGRALRCGKNVKRIKEGDYVTCHGWSRHQVMKEAGLFAFSRPPGDPASTLVEPVSCVAGALFHYNIMPGDRVLLLGSGYMGLLNVIGLAHSPISELVATDLKEKNLQLARSFGATHTINSATELGLAELEGLRRDPFDLVVECAGVQETLDQATKLTRAGGRLAIFSWHHEPRPMDLGTWHGRGFTVLNTAPMMSTDRSISTMERAMRLIERGMFDQSQLITHRHSLTDVQAAMELADERPDEYIKSVLLFD